jgi:putative tricarboxylic transport membrane protein
MKPANAISLGQLLVGLFWVGLAALVFYGIRSLAPAEPGGLGPATFPKILAVSLSALVALYWFQSWKAAPIPFLKKDGGGSLLKAACLSGLALSAALLWEPVGALPVLVALSLIELRWIEGFSWVRVLCVGLTLSIGMWVVFTQALGVNLPLGILMWFF